MCRLRRKYVHTARKGLIALICKELLPVNKRKVNNQGEKVETKGMSRGCQSKELMLELWASKDPESGKTVITC